ncbi:hypothetical protein BGX26_005849 [Mortierella sp. AD094]|nr:hypothetical protein BGX26_005849 [Mortierella sp. AD094]
MEQLAVTSAAATSNLVEDRSSVSEFDILKGAKAVEADLKPKPEVWEGERLREILKQMGKVPKQPQVHDYKELGRHVLSKDISGIFSKCQNPESGTERYAAAMDFVNDIIDTASYGRMRAAHAEPDIKEVTVDVPCAKCLVPVRLCVRPEIGSNSEALPSDGYIVYNDVVARLALELIKADTTEDAWPGGPCPHCNAEMDRTSEKMVDVVVDRDCKEADDSHIPSLTAANVLGGLSTKAWPKDVPGMVSSDECKPVIDTLVALEQAEGRAAAHTAKCTHLQEAECYAPKAFLMHRDDDEMYDEVMSDFIGAPAFNKRIDLFLPWSGFVAMCRPVGMTLELARIYAWHNLIAAIYDYCGAWIGEGETRLAISSVAYSMIAMEKAYAISPEKGKVLEEEMRIAIEVIRGRVACKRSTTSDTKTAAQSACIDVGSLPIESYMSFRMIDAAIPYVMLIGQEETQGCSTEAKLGAYMIVFQNELVDTLGDSLCDERANHVRILCAREGCGATRMAFTGSFAASLALCKAALWDDSLAVGAHVAATSSAFYHMFPRYRLCAQYCLRRRAGVHSSEVALPDHNTMTAVFGSWWTDRLEQELVGIRDEYSDATAMQLFCGDPLGQVKQGILIAEPSHDETLQNLLLVQARLWVVEAELDVPDEVVVQICNSYSIFTSNLAKAYCDKMKDAVSRSYDRLPFDATEQWIRTVCDYGVIPKLLAASSVSLEKLTVQADKLSARVCWLAMLSCQMWVHMAEDDRNLCIRLATKRSYAACLVSASALLPPNTRSLGKTGFPCKAGFPSRFPGKDGVVVVV